MTKTIIIKSRIDLEAEISRAIIHYEKEYMGRGPVETRTYVLDELVVVRLRGVLTPAEKVLAKAQTERSGYLLKQVRNELLASGREMLETLMGDILGVRVQSIHTDISTKTGERIIVFTLCGKLQFSEQEESSLV